MASSIAACISSTVISVFTLVFSASALPFGLSLSASVSVLTSLVTSVSEVELVLWLVEHPASIAMHMAAVNPIARHLRIPAICLIYLFFLIRSSPY